MDRSQLPPEDLKLPEDIANAELEAKQRYDRWANRDPFPLIPPALLNSADVYDYVRVTGMILPFDRDYLKASSYEVSIGERYIYWDGSGANHDIFMEDGQEFFLEPNSIGFVITKEYFRLPNYIGARFNLRIANVHRGILLGTGPLVDPGFQGHLFVPLHNLTTNKYKFVSGEKFAWFEFTKVSPNEWNPEYESLKQKYDLRGQYVPFPQPKIDRAQDPRKYLVKAWPGGEIRSSIPEVVADSEESAKQARGDAEKARGDASRASTDADKARAAAERARDTLYRIGVFAAVGVVVAVAALLYSSWQLVTDMGSSIAGLERDQAVLESRLPSDVPDLALLSSEVRRIADEVDGLASALGGLSGPRPVQAQLEELRALVADLQAELEALRHESDQSPPP